MNTNASAGVDLLSIQTGPRDAAELAPANLRQRWRWYEFLLIKFGVWVGLIVLTRLLPHMANFSPFLPLVLLAGYQWTPRLALGVTFCGLLLSDVFLAFVWGTPVLGSWTLFTYSGIALMALGSARWLARPSLAMGTMFSGSAIVLYWVWTNFGTWLSGGLYPHSSAGLLTCFVAGLPFLQMSALSALLFTPLFFGGLKLLEHWDSRFSREVICR
jgi:hypothetical protein